MAPNLPKHHRPKVHTAQMQDERILGERRKEAFRNSISRDLQKDALIRNQERFFEIAEQKRRYRESVAGMNSIGGVDTHANVDPIPLRNARPPGLSNNVSKHDTKQLDANSTFDLGNEALKHKIINSSPELKDLKRKLNFALLAQEWQAQVEAHKAQEVQAKQLVAAETLLELQRMELEETKRRETEANRAKEYRVSLKHQLEQHQAAKTYQELELKLQEQKLDALQMHRLDSRFEADKMHRARQQNELLKYLELSQQMKEAEKQKEEQRLNREEEEIRAYNQLLSDRQSLLAEKHARIEQEKQSIYNKLYNDLLNAEQARQQAYDATLDTATEKYKVQQLKKDECEFEFHKQKKLEALKQLQQQILENTISRHQAKLQDRELNQKELQHQQSRNLLQDELHKLKIQQQQDYLQQVQQAIHQRKLERNEQSKQDKITKEQLLNLESFRTAVIEKERQRLEREHEMKLQRIKQKLHDMARTLKGTLIECDPSIKTMLLDMDSKMANKFIMSELDETHLLIDTTRVQEVQEMLQNIIEENTYAVNQ